MILIDAATADTIYAAMPPGQESSGGSAANTCAVAAGLGSRVAYIGKVADDQLGGVFRHDINAVGVHFPTAPLSGGAPTARCLILVTPDGQRTMNTFLGACVTLGEADVDPALVAASAVTYLEGYLFDPPEAQAAFRKAAEAAHAAGRQVALSLSDAFCVNRHRAAFLDLVVNQVDILFANETEITALYERNSFEEAAEAARKDVALAALTRSEAGSLILQGEPDGEDRCGTHRGRRHHRGRRCLCGGVPGRTDLRQKPGDLRPHGQYRRRRNHQPLRCSAANRPAQADALGIKIAWLGWLGGGVRAANSSPWRSLCKPRVLTEQQSKSSDHDDGTVRPRPY